MGELGTRSRDLPSSSLWIVIVAPLPSSGICESSQLVETSVAYLPGGAVDLLNPY